MADNAVKAALKASAESIYAAGWIAPAVSCPEVSLLVPGLIGRAVRSSWLRLAGRQSKAGFRI